MNISSQTMIKLTECFTQVGRYDLLLVIFFACAATNLLDLLGHEQLLNLVQDTLSAKFIIFFFPSFSRGSMSSPVTSFRGIDLIPVEGFELLLRPYNG